ncbi:MULTISPECIES: two-component system histidine kinase PnpS [unclassified Virgibacillus]|uniref:two-component system histidine kinase PnpS n=1 Tax=unclassified Virgibacillus TaxID=2620237 RepID=UPI0024DE2373|nr:HAMP domain-containing sensor histidine kinase [Virgibacillus sp. LDC-1]
MKAIFSKSLFGYAIGLFVVIVLSGVFLSFIMEDILLLISILAVEFIILILGLLHIFDRYIKPIHKASRTMDELVRGNYRARIHHPINGIVGELTRKINVLARNLSELSIQEQIQSEQLSTVIDNTESGLVLIDGKGYIHLVNRKFLSMFGKTQKDYIGYLYYDVIENEKIHRTVQDAFLYERNVKQSFTKASGQGERHIEIVGAPIFNERNLLKGAVLVFYDITELKRLEVMRKDFVANVSHELKTPITSIKGFAETLLDEESGNDETNGQFLNIIYEESTRLQNLIDDLLTLSRLEKDEIQLSVSPVEIRNLVDEVIPVIKQKIEEKNIQLTIKMDDNITFTADRYKVKQILINLLENAVNYTGPQGKVELTVLDSDDFVTFVIKDSGIGIPQEAIGRIFERFYRVDKARSRNTGGTGLGLAIVKHIIEVHKGKITVESEHGKGSTFTILLPKKQHE